MHSAVASHHSLPEYFYIGVIVLAAIVFVVMYVYGEFFDGHDE